MVEIHSIQGLLVGTDENKADVSFNISGINDEYLNIRLEESDGERRESSYTLRTDSDNTDVSSVIGIVKRMAVDILNDSQIDELTNFIKLLADK